MEIVLDKSFLHAAKTSAVRATRNRHDILFSEPLFYELLTTTEEKRAMCFSKLPEGLNPVTLIPRAGPLLHFEKENNRPVGPLSEHAIDVPFSFNPGLRRQGFTMEADQTQALYDWQHEIDGGVAAFPALARSITEWCPSLRELRDTELAESCRELKERACSSPDVVCGIFSSLELENFPAASSLSPEWAIFRWLQSHLLFYLDHIARYGFTDEDSVAKRIEHDLHDIEYAILGSLAGALATCDRDLQTNFRLMRSDGVSVTKGTSAVMRAHPKASARPRSGPARGKDPTR